jgi:hypothetical protein
MDTDPQTFGASLQGYAVECTTVEDAIAVIRADAVLREKEACKPAELDRLAAVVLRYGHHRFAEALSNRAVRLRAAEFLLNMTGYEFPR